MQLVLPCSILGLAHLLLEALFPRLTRRFPKAGGLGGIRAVHRLAPCLEFLDQLIGVIREFGLFPGEVVEFPALLVGEFGSLPTHRLVGEIGSAFAEFREVLGHLLDLPRDHPGILTTVEQLREIGEFLPHVLLGFARIAFRLGLRT